MSLGFILKISIGTMRKWVKNCLIHTMMCQQVLIQSRGTWIDLQNPGSKPYAHFSIDSNTMQSLKLFIYLFLYASIKDTTGNLLTYLQIKWTANGEAGAEILKKTYYNLTFTAVWKEQSIVMVRLMKISVKWQTWKGRNLSFSFFLISYTWGKEFMLMKKSKF